jgi:hypothetical protein
MAVERKYERDVDLLLAEEFAINTEFAAAFLGLTKFAGRHAVVDEFWVSKSSNLGESDLIVVLKGADGDRFALLIEDKVDAPLQPDQAERYRLRADRDLAAGAYSDYEVMLCAPQHYIDSRSDLGGFDRLISLERIAAMLHQDGTLRGGYRARFLETAATRRVNSWAREIDIATDEFWAAGYLLATREFPILEMKKLKLTKNSTWINFRPHDFPTRPKRIYVSFKGDRGQIDLTFSNTAAYRFEPLVKALLDADMFVHQTKASAAIRIETEGFDIEAGIERELPKLRASFEASARLLSFYRRFRSELDIAVMDSASV